MFRVLVVKDLVPGSTAEFLVFGMVFSWWSRPGLVTLPGHLRDALSVEGSGPGSTLRGGFVVCGPRLSRRSVCPGRPLRRSNEPIMLRPAHPQRAYYAPLLPLDDQSRYEPIMLHYRQLALKTGSFVYLMLAYLITSMA